MSSSSSRSPCAACKFLQVNCTQECVFAPYFPADQPDRFYNVHQVFGASNVAKMLNGISPQRRKDVANSLAYEAELRIDPVNGCFGKFLVLYEEIRKKRHDFEVLRREMAADVGSAAADAAAARAAAYATAVVAAEDALRLKVFGPPPPFYNHPQQQEAPPAAPTSGVQMGADEPTEAASSSGQLFW
ncbi:putative LOB domain-containing protein 36 [Iris pallida]|uniref:LOB domain-containing protein 36 n=1 Tax=Iris pallida TaxID=29817 RepID=A0AAX6FSB4_IRIPA|nr:putative LOB domain-containing protein 36 [Iris pallida]KAJ6852770.1 putative LOB domain-containing protein 36 [Iris pallida]KAJ6852771.1 putative LOB domain-containing protein 36 [Iris pallida]